MGQYISREDVELTVKGKIKFSNDPDDEDRMPYKLLDRLIDEAESDVELELSIRYLTPFVGQDGTPFAQLPKTTKRMIQLLTRMRVVMLLMDTDFGAGSALDGDNFTKGYIIQYNSMRKKAIAKVDNGWGWSFPPLPNLRLQHGNSEADDGYKGMIMHTTEHKGAFPSAQINDPSQNFWNAHIDRIDGEHDRD